MACICGAVKPFSCKMALPSIMAFSDLVLNSPFTFLRTLGVKSFKKTDFNISQSVVDENFQPIKFYKSNSPSTPNIILIITESMSREYIGAFNKDANIKDYVSYTPFLDSLATKSLIFTNAYGNGYKSIHGMSSIISGIPPTSVVMIVVLW